MELEQLLEESIEHQEKEFYKKKMYFSYSSLNKLIWNPQVFYQMYVLGNKEERLDAHLVQGKVIHALLLEEEKFKDDFIISPANLPTGTLRIVLDRLYRKFANPQGDLNDYSQEILDIMKDVNYFQALKTDQQRLDKVLTSDAINYWSFLKTKGSRILIDQETYDFCKNAVELIKTDKNLYKLIGCNMTDFDNKEVYNELFLQAELSGKPFGLKGIIDNLVIDHDDKTIYINDIKTTSKDLKDFPETVDFYSYWMQAVIYCSLVGVNYKSLIENDGYQLKFHFVVIDRAFQTYAFPIADNTLLTWLNKLNDVFDKADWHYTNQSYNLPYEFATGKVIL